MSVFDHIKSIFEYEREVHEKTVKRLASRLGLVMEKEIVVRSEESQETNRHYVDINGRGGMIYRQDTWFTPTSEDGSIKKKEIKIRELALVYGLLKGDVLKLLGGIILPDENTFMLSCFIKEGILKELEVDDPGNEVVLYLDLSELAKRLGEI